LCDRRLDTAGGVWNELAWWNRLGCLVVFNEEIALRNASRLALDNEMTLKILELRAAREENHGRWPESPTGLRTSDVCPDDRWTYALTPTGAMILTLSRDLDWGPQIGLVLPTRYESRGSDRRDVGDPPASRRASAR
jgi:hypothetical protein